MSKDPEKLFSATHIHEETEIPYKYLTMLLTKLAKADILKATQAQSDAIEAQIKEEPKFWFWCHKRWKTEDPEIYKY